MLQIMNSSALVQYDSDDIIFKEGEYSQGIFYVLEGEI